MTCHTHINTVLTTLTNFTNIIVINFKGKINIEIFFKKKMYYQNGSKYLNLNFVAEKGIKKNRDDAV